MVTRLRSDKGSFVQSPKFAFDSESALSTGNVQVIDNVTRMGVTGPNSGGNPSSQCTISSLQSGGGVIPGWQRTFFTFDEPASANEYTIAQLLNGTYVGDTSGETYTPNTYFEPLEEWCLNTNLINRIHHPASVIEIIPPNTWSSGHFTVLSHFATGPNQNAITAHINYNRFLVPPLGFQHLETFTFTP